MKATKNLLGNRIRIRPFNEEDVVKSLSWLLVVAAGGKGSAGEFGGKIHAVVLVARGALVCFGAAPHKSSTNYKNDYTICMVIIHITLVFC